ncbi:dTDP-4-dehydrorhamnose reductase [Rhizobium leguminosarum bv. trifolii WSM2297]|uniref:dTDP-4-dehydrorhamnose reductase n=1 Tax=Rhizobium leguminosarum bv. trifolii WSM2297 TaxID=754762 RepID=J0KXZ3_RHILT|nr:SDR family oxidoreductase [Rhizobium leguminosarum]EJC82679.1 dTDP-4-dehydrorhamnose reductase [Rhizobium leguminosarum bv. trifolii WSM2297]
MNARWLIVGGSGMLGHALSASLIARGIQVWATTGNHSMAVSQVASIPLDLSSDFDAGTLLHQVKPDVVVYAAGLTDVDKCESNETLARRLHAGAAREFAAASVGTCRFLYISSDHLWDGARPNVAESDPVHPLNAYARTKVTGERMTLQANPETLVLRTNFFGRGLPWRKSLSDWMTDCLRAGEPLGAFADAHFTPIAMPLLSDYIARCMSSNLSGVYHCAGSERISKFEFATRLAGRLGLDEKLVVPRFLADAGLKALRPLDMSLSTRKLAEVLGHPLPNISASLDALSYENVA